MHEKTEPPSSSRSPGGELLDAVDVDGVISYCNHVSFHLYRFYLAGLAGADLYLSYVRRGLAKWLQLQYASLTSEQRDDAVQRALVSLWTVAARGRLSTENPSHYAKYIIKVCRSSVINTLNDRNLHPASHYLDAKGWRGTTATIPAPAETVAFLHELPTVLHRQVVEGSRLAEAPEAYRYVIECLWDGDEPELYVLRGYGVTNPQFFVEHVTLRLRTLLYNMRGTIEVFGRGDDLRMLAVYEAPE